MKLMISQRFLKIAKDMPKEIRGKLMRILYELISDYRHPGLQTKKLNGGSGDVYECRVDQSVRLVYDVSGGALRCLYIGPHDEAIRFGEALARAGSGYTIEEVVVGTSDGTVAEGVFQEVAIDGVANEFVVVARGDG